MVVSDYKGRLPQSYEGLQELPGLGPYCAAAIASIAFGEKVPVVDGNVLRVITRLYAMPDDISKPATRNKIFDLLTPLIAKRNPSNFNQAVMEIGALVCKPSNPDCDNCPLRTQCVAYKTKRVSEFPYKPN